MQMLLHFKELGFKKNRHESIEAFIVWCYVKTRQQCCGHNIALTDWMTWIHLVHKLLLIMIVAYCDEITINGRYTINS